MANQDQRRAKIHRLAIEVLGNADLAERWLLAPAIGLDQRVPADLIQTPEGTEQVETYLRQIDYCVYV